MRRTARGLRRTAARFGTADDLFDAAENAAIGGRSFGPSQIRGEIAQLLELVRADRPMRVLEIGTANGGTLYLLAAASAPRSRVLSLDVRGFDWTRLRVYRTCVARRHIEVWTRDSYHQETRDEVAAFFGRPLDVLFVDGDHAYEGVKRDYELYAPLVRSGGLIAFHDIVDGPASSVGGVPRFWREIRDELGDAQELVESWQQQGYGIGVGRRRSG